MSERMFRFLLSELKIIRLVCKSPGCNKVTEVRLEDLAPPGMLRKFIKCPFCEADYDPLSNGESAIHKFAAAAKLLQSMSKIVEIEFSIPDLDKV
jgi:hypothetical protein